jgi:FAD:protein FMN transferase
VRRGAMRRGISSLFLGVTAGACGARGAPAPPAEPREEVPIAIHHAAMGCMFRVFLHGETVESARGLEGEVADCLDRAEKALSVWDPQSEVSQLNARAAREAVTAGALLWQTVERSVRWSERTQGAFDVTVGPLVEAFGLRTQNPHAPPPEALARARAIVGWRHLLLDPQKQTIAFDKEGVALDLDGIDKGIAVDLVGELLRRRGVRDATIDAGGSSILSIGPPAGAPPRRIAIEDDRGWEACTVELRDSSLSTSGNWRRMALSGDSGIGHIFDPRAGDLVRSDIVSATVLAPRCADSDALAKACLVLQREEAAQILRHEGASAVLLLAKGSGADRETEVVRIP